MSESAGGPGNILKNGGRRRKGIKQVKRNFNQDSLVGNTTYNSAAEDFKVIKNVAPENSTNEKLTGTPVEASGTDTDACIICASDVIHEGLGPCNHRTCHVCSIRMRVLFKDQTCTLCRASAPYIIITDNREKRFEDFTDEHFKQMNFESIEENIGLRFDSAQIREDVLWMLGYNCPEKECDVVCLAWPHLHDHTRRAHGKKICDLCSKNRKIFPHEHQLFTDADLSYHMKKGDKITGTYNQSGFKGHPLCNFCGNRYFGDDELYNHLREKHERCFVCDRANPGRPPSYYVNYNELRLHFIKDHFICKMKDCLDQKYIAFASEFELKAHMLEVHGGELSKEVRRDTRNIDLSDFSYRQPYEQEIRATGSLRVGRERGRDTIRGRERRVDRNPTSEPLSSYSTQPLRRDEQAFQRQLAIHSTQSGTSWVFGHQLTTPTQHETREIEHQTSEASENFRNFEASTIDDPNNMNSVQTNITPHERARSLRNTAVNERVSLLLKRDSTKISRFNGLISNFTNGSIGARNLIDTFFTLFSNTSSNALGSLIREIADLLDDTKKADELRTAWNNWRAIHEDYPSLPTVSSSDENSALFNWAARNGNASSVSGTTSSIRIMKLKKSTVQSGGASASESRSWTSTSQNSGPMNGESNTGKNVNLSAFPSLPSPPMNQNTNATRKNAVTPWSSTIKASTFPSESGNSSGPSKRSIISTSSGEKIVSGSKIARDAFPALPNIAKSQSKVPGQENGIFKKGVGGSLENAWRTSGEASSSIRVTHGDAEGEDDNDIRKGKKKGNKAKKQVIIGWG